MEQVQPFVVILSLIYFGLPILCLILIIGVFVTCCVCILRCIYNCWKKRGKMREKMQSVHPAGYYSISSQSCDPDTVSINSASGIFHKQPMVGNYRHSASSPHTIYEIDTATTPVNYGSAKFFKNQSLHGPQSSSSLYPLLSSRS